MEDRRDDAHTHTTQDKRQLQVLYKSESSEICIRIECSWGWAKGLWAGSVRLKGSGLVQGRRSTSPYLNLGNVSPTL